MPLGILKSLFSRLRSNSLDWDEILEILILADLGVRFSEQFVNKLKQSNRCRDEQSALQFLREEIVSLFYPSPPPLTPHPDRPRTILFVGVNGTGKTTTIAKLAHRLKKAGHSVLLAAADTFRAAAIEQLSLWAEKIGVPVIRSQYQSDPAALCYDAYQAARSRDVDFLLCDTAGRLHTRQNLMREVAKIARTLAKHGPDLPDEKWIVVDATTGSNCLSQAKEFHEAVGLTGVILTKMDGS
ncbi:MAG: AAA family ATPase, partial [Chthoniobacterales bacterium]|nr:AAA family ATPase [Chthoniobacterales bacterium]